MAIRFTSPGAAAGNALRDFLIQREHERRTALLDGLLVEDRMRQRAHEEMERARQSRLDAQADADRLAGIHGPQNDLSPAAADVLRRGGYDVAERTTLPGRSIDMTTTPTGAGAAGPIVPGRQMASTSYQRRGETHVEQLAREQREAAQAERDEARRFRDDQAENARAFQAEQAGLNRAAAAEQHEMNRDLRRDVANANRVLTDGGYSPKQVVTFNQIAGSYERSPLIKAADRTIVLQDAVKAVRRDPSNAANQMNLAYGYIQALDTYQSAVREGELQNLGALGTRLQQLAVEANKVATTGAFMPPDVAKQIATSAEQLVTTIKAGRKRKQQEYASRAKVSGVGKMWDEFVGGFVEPQEQGASGSGGNDGVVRWGRDANGRPVRLR
jgi:hypothetical protein